MSKSDDTTIKGDVLKGDITDVPGIEVGHFTETRRPTGCSVVMTKSGAVCGVDVRGSAPGTRETDLLSPVNFVDKVHALLLSGGSAFGLDAATGVMRWLEHRSIGFPVGPTVVPIVPAAVLFDLHVGDASVRPDAAAGYAACDAASSNAIAQGSVGAGTGAVVGKLFGMHRAMKGGIGSASIRVGDIVVGALVACNAVGDVIDPSTGNIIAGARTEDGKSFVDSQRAILSGERNAKSPLMSAGAASQGSITNTTIGVVATNATLTKAQAQKLAQVSHDGLARTIQPVHTMSDGDTMFALGTGTVEGAPDMLTLCTMAAHVTALAVVQAIKMAEALHTPDLPSYSSFKTR